MVDRHLPPSRLEVEEPGALARVFGLLFVVVPTPIAALCLAAAGLAGTLALAIFVRVLL